MSNAPAWLRCENCLWYVFSTELGHPGCNFAQTEVTGNRSPFSRCEEWTCKRCFQDWFHAKNHLYCPIIARKKPVKEVLYDR